jgi:hypothetical protein
MSYCSELSTVRNKVSNSDGEQHSDEPLVLALNSANLSALPAGNSSPAALLEIAVGGGAAEAEAEELLEQGSRSGGALLPAADVVAGQDQGENGLVGTNRNVEQVVTNRTVCSANEQNFVGTTQQQHDQNFVAGTEGSSGGGQMRTALGEFISVPRRPGDDSDVTSNIDSSELATGSPEHPSAVGTEDCLRDISKETFSSMDRRSVRMQVLGQHSFGDSLHKHISTDFETLHSDNTAFGQLCAATEKGLPEKDADSDEGHANNGATGNPAATAFAREKMAQQLEQDSMQNLER